MYTKIKTNLVGLSVALGFLLVGFGLGHPPSTPESSVGVSEPTLIVVSLDDARKADDDQRPASRRQGALKRHLAMPYVSFAAIVPRQES